jgi:hypothetical protein
MRTEWSAEFEGGYFLYTMHCSEVGYPPRFGGWQTWVFDPNADELIGDPLIFWLYLTEREAAIGHQIAVALLQSGWRGGEIPDVDVEVA